VPSQRFYAACGAANFNTLLNGAYYGRGLEGAERARVMAADDTRLRDRIYFYTSTGRGVQPEYGVGGYAHSVELNNLYDFDADPLNLRAGRSLNDQESAILDAGFDGFIAPFGNDRKAAVLLGPKHSSVPVRQEQPGYRGEDTPAAGKAAPNKFNRLSGLIAQPHKSRTAAEWALLVKEKDPALFSELGGRKAFTGDGYMWPDQIAAAVRGNEVGGLRASPPRNDLSAKVAELKAMTADERDNLDVYAYGYRAYQAYEAETMMPKKEGTMRTVTENNSFTLYQEADALANVNGKPYLATKQEDPDDENDEGLFVWRFDDPFDPDAPGFDSAFADKADAIAEFKAHLAGTGILASLRRRPAGQTAGVNDYLVPDVSPYKEQPGLVDLAYLSGKPIRLTVGVQMGDHRGTGLTHIATEAKSDTRRVPPDIDPVRDDFSDDLLADVLRTLHAGVQVYSDRGGVVLHSRTTNKAVVLGDSNDKYFGDFWTVKTVYPTGRRDVWGAPEGAGRLAFPATPNETSGASQNRNLDTAATQPSPSWLEVTSEQFQFMAEVPKVQITTRKRRPVAPDSKSRFSTKRPPEELSIECL
jgi:hypothetical protein